MLRAFIRAAARPLDQLVSLRLNFLLQIIILSMKDMNVAKLTSDDLPLFLDITTDLFPNVDVPVVDYEEIISYITKEAVKMKLQVISLTRDVT